MAIEKSIAIFINSEETYYISDRVTAPDEHTDVQVWQPSQESPWATTALPPFISNTLTGQLFAHSSHPSHLSASTATIYIEISSFESLNQNGLLNYKQSSI
jgi:hypothetical protein